MIKLTKMIGIPLLLVVIMTTSNTSLAEEKRTLEEIVVTAQKRESTLQKTSLAISAITGDTLKKAGVFDTYGLADLSPNLLIGQ